MGLIYLYLYTYIYSSSKQIIWNHQLHSDTEVLEKAVSNYVAGLETTCDVISERDYILIFPVLPYVGLILVATYNALNDLYSSPSIVREIKSRRMRWAGHVARMGEERGAYRFLVGKPEGKRPLGRPRRRLVDNIRMDLQEVGCGYVDWIGLAQDRDSWPTLVSAVMNLRVP